MRPGPAWPLQEEGSWLRFKFRTDEWPGTGHQHVSRVPWYSPQSGEVNDIAVREMAAWLTQTHPDRAYVCDGHREIEVGVVAGYPPYLRTHKKRSGPTTS